ncbi:P-loop containing nucleoside triphosphate hydrolase protein [Calycina marina]|uniref:P-loop containing nucleoside triphosphate hydrolase protein n=1 Tax=Calycina marina TaxID=1763456 RepID=A0A9P8CIG1_9HELO|nr:P-loop containing nucleoside triphosphate hydrolase protein [Calycina marina]
MAGNKPGKPKSKRVSVRLRHKIEKASSAKQKKSRKAEKKNPEWRSKLKKDPGIPNLFPYKDKILAEIEEGRKRKAEDAANRRAEAKATKTIAQTEREVEARIEGVYDEEIEAMGSDMDEDIDFDEDANPMAALLASARAAAQDYEEGSSDDDEMNEDDESNSENDVGGVELNGLPTRKDGSRKAFDKIFKQVVDAADVVLYVLDARDPEGTRSKEVERMVMAAASGGKRLILILNKIDLIPAAVLKAWLIHLRRYFPTLPLRASGPAANAHTFNHKSLTVQSTSATLFKALKSYAAAKQLKRAVSVGVIGYPNVGKSSVINALTSRMGSAGAACPVGAEAGVTTSLREVKIDSKLKLLDSPGIVFPSAVDGSKASKTEEQARLVLLNAVPPKQIEDPVPAVTLLLRRLSKSKDMIEKLMAVYGLPALLTTNGDPTMDFLVQVARKRGRLGKGGIPNIASAATTVIADWRDGRIQGWMDAPVLAVAPSVPSGMDVDSNVIGDQKEIVSEWAAEFKLEGLWGDGKDMVDESMQE